MEKIESLLAREIFDSRGNPTIEVELKLSDGSLGRAAVPSGASTGKYEAVELRDNDPNRYNGKGVLKAVENVNSEIAQAVGGSAFDQSSLDQKLIELDGTKNKERLGANAILGVSLAFSHAASASQKLALYEYFHLLSQIDAPIVLPVPLVNILNGGRHALNSTDFQEFMIVPCGAESFSEALRYATETFNALGEILKNEGFERKIGDEGGFAVPLKNNEKAIELLIKAIEKAGFLAGKDIFLALDVAASEFFDSKENKYILKTENRSLNSAQMIDYYAEIVRKYPIISIEDPLAEDDWQGWQLLTEKLGQNLQLVGDDLFVTNLDRLKEGIEKKAANAILIKPNQIGTLSETIAAVKMAKDAGYRTIISHRSGETKDSTIADLAVGLGCGQIKTGSVGQAERMAKYNRLVEIEKELGEKANFAGNKIFGL